MKELKPRYQVPITRREAENFMRANIGAPRFPIGCKFFWVAGIHYVTDQPGLYLISAAGGSCGVMVLAPAAEQVGEQAS